MNREELKKLYVANGLSETDIFKMKMGGKDIPIITRSGIEKIQAKNNIAVTFSVQMLNPEFVVIKATGSITGKTIETFGEASTANCKNKFIVAMAEKRALSRVVLKCVGMYEHGFMGEDELGDIYDYNVEPLFQLIESSTFDSDKQTILRVEAQNLNTLDQYKDFVNNLEMNQLAPEDRAHGRTSAAEDLDRLKRKGL